MWLVVDNVHHNVAHILYLKKWRSVGDMKYLFSACFCCFSDPSVCAWHLCLIRTGTFCLFVCLFVSTAGWQSAATWSSEYSFSFSSSSALHKILQSFEDPLRVFFLWSEYQWWMKKHLLSLWLDIRKILCFTYRYLYNSFIRTEGCCYIKNWM